MSLPLVDILETKINVLIYVSFYFYEVGLSVKSDITNLETYGLISRHICDIYQGANTVQL